MFDLYRRTKQIILCREDIKLPAGKVAAQASHASLGVIKQCMGGAGTALTSLPLHPGTALAQWWDNDWTKVALGVPTFDEFNELVSKFDAMGLQVCVVEDNGLTVYHDVKTVTCAGVEPFWADELEKVVGHLKLFKGGKK